MKKQIVLCFFIVAMFQSLTSNGQNLPDSTRTFRIETKDGNIYTGSIISEDQTTLVLRTERLGEIRIPQIDIKSRTELKEVRKVEGKIWLPNPQSTRYFWAPNGYGLEKGSAYYQNIWILYNQASIGVTNNFSVGAGVLPLFLFAGTPTPFWIVPKFSIPVVKNKFNIGAGAFLGTVIGSESGVYGLLYGTTTFGSRDQNASLGLAYGFTRDQWLDIPIFNLSSMIRYSARSYFITENYAITSSGETVILISVGGRTIIRNIGLDYSLWLPFGADNTFIAIPFLGVTIPLGSSK